MDSSSDSRDFAVLRCVRRGRGVALEIVSESEFSVAVDFDFEWCRRGTPVGRTSFGFCSTGELGVSAATHATAKAIAANQIWERRFTGG